VGSDQRLIFGLGSGRCGTKSLSSLLRSQADSCITHEGEPFLPWLADPGQLDARMQAFAQTGAAVAGDVAFFLLPYVPMIWKRDPEARFVCLQRERATCLESLIAKMQQAKTNLYQHHDGRRWRSRLPAERQLPKYDHAATMEHAIGRYYDDYYHQAQWFATDRPEHFRIFPMTDLNTTEGVEGILNFAGYPRSEQHVRIGICQNQLEVRRSDTDLRA